MSTTSVLQLVYSSIMARLLAPEAFGIIAISQIVINFTAYFSRLGMGQALIQREGLGTKDIRAVFTSSVFLAVAFTMAIWLLAPMSTQIFPKIDHKVTLVTRVMALSFFFNGLSITSINLLVKKLKLKKLAVIEISSFVIGYLFIGILLGFLGFGVWALVGAHLSQSILAATLGYAATRHSIIPIFKWKYHKGFFSYGSQISVINILEFFSSNMAILLIGRFFGDYKLGLYRQANMISQLPPEKFNQSVQKVMFPAFSKVQSDIPKLKKSFLAIITLVAALSFPLCFTMSVAAQEIILVVFGEKFREAIPVLKILSLGVGFRLLSSYAGTVCDATAKLKGKFIVQLLYLLLLTSFAFSFKNYGLVAFALIIVIGDVVRNIAYMAVAGSILKIPFKDFAKAYFPGVASGIVIAISVFLCTHVMDHFELPMALKLISQIFIGAALLIVFTLVKPIPGLREILKGGFQKLPVFPSWGRALLGHLSWYKD